MAVVSQSIYFADRISLRIHNLLLGNYNVFPYNTSVCLAAAGALNDLVTLNREILSVVAYV